MIQRIFCLGVLVFFCAACDHTAPALQSPFDVHGVRQNKGQVLEKKFTCPDAPSPVIDLAFERFYTDKHSSKIDLVAHQKYKEAYRPLNQFENQIINWANDYVRSNPPRGAYASCVLNWLEGWAADDALLGEVTKNGEYVRKWMLASVAAAYVQVKDDPGLNNDKKRAVEKWLRKIARVVISDYSTDIEKRSRQNNHLYWAAWSVAIAGVAVQDEEFFEWGMGKARFGLDQVQGDGTLPHELYRKSKALRYHLFAAMPLVLLAETAMVNGIDLYDYNDGALHRLVKRGLSGIDDPSYIAEKAGAPQDAEKVISRSQLAWIEIYHARFSENQQERIAKFQKSLRPLKLSRVGGDTTLLFAK